MEKGKASAASFSSSSSSISSSSNHSGAVDDSSTVSKKRRHQHRTRARKSSCSSRRSPQKVLGRKHIKDEHSKSRKERSTNRKGKHHSDDAQVFNRIDQRRSRKKRRKRQVDDEVDESEKPIYIESNKGARHKLIDHVGDMPLKKRSNSSLQEMMNMQEQQKAMIRHNAEIAKALLESGEFRRANDEQIKMHQLYGTADWRFKKKLRMEKRILERTVAAGKKLASLEEQEHARMDAFRVALGLPTAEAQRQAEWRAEATQELIEMEARSKCAGTAKNGFRSSKHALIGPSLPP